MTLFEIGQIWNSNKLRGEVIEIADGGRSGVVAITDDKGAVGKYSGTAAGFQDQAQWKFIKKSQFVVGQSPKV
jgi:hypothetical protein